MSTQRGPAKRREWRILIGMHGWTTGQVAKEFGVGATRVSQVTGREWKHRINERIIRRSAMRRAWVRYLRSMRPRESVWNRERIVDALRDFHEERGRSPRASELGAGNGDYLHERVEWLPDYRTLQAYFGSSRAAFMAAGIPSRGPGERLRREAG